MYLNFSTLTQKVLNEQAQRMAVYFNIDVVQIKQINGVIVPILIALIIQKINTEEGSNHFYSTVASTHVDSNISSNLGSIFYSSVAIQNLITIGCSHVDLLISNKSQNLSQTTAQHMSFNVNTAVSLIGIISATIFGLLKQYLKMYYGQQDLLILMIRQQIMHVEKTIDEVIWISLNIGNSTEVLKTIEENLKKTKDELNGNIQSSLQLSFVEILRKFRLWKL